MIVVGRRKIIKIRMETNEIENRKTIEKVNKSPNWHHMKPILLQYQNIQRHKETKVHFLS